MKGTVDTDTEVSKYLGKNKKDAQDTSAGSGFSTSQDLNGTG